jgi:hypothetical protein
MKTKLLVVLSISIAMIVFCGCQGSAPNSKEPTEEQQQPQKEKTLGEIITEGSWSDAVEGFSVSFTFFPDQTFTSKDLCVIPFIQLFKNDSGELSTILPEIAILNPEEAQLSTHFALFPARFSHFQAQFTESGRIFPIPGLEKSI